MKRIIITIVTALTLMGSADAYRRSTAEMVRAIDPIPAYLKMNKQDANAVNQADIHKTTAAIAPIDTVTPIAPTVKTVVAPVSTAVSTAVAATAAAKTPAVATATGTTAAGTDLMQPAQTQTWGAFAWNLGKRVLSFSGYAINPLAYGSAYVTEKLVTKIFKLSFIQKHLSKDKAVAEDTANFIGSIAGIIVAMTTGYIFNPFGFTEKTLTALHFLLTVSFGMELVQHLGNIVIALYNDQKNILWREAIASFIMGLLMFDVVRTTTANGVRWTAKKSAESFCWIANNTVNAATCSKISTTANTVVDFAEQKCLFVKQNVINTILDRFPRLQNGANATVDAIVTIKDKLGALGGKLGQLFSTSSNSTSAEQPKPTNPPQAPPREVKDIINEHFAKEGIGPLHPEDAPKAVPVSQITKPTPAAVSTSTAQQIETCTQNSGLPASTCASAITIENQVDIDQTALCLHESGGIYPACPSTIKKGNAGGCYDENTYDKDLHHNSHITLSQCNNMNSNSAGSQECCTVYQADAPKVSPKPAAARTTAAVPTPTAQQIETCTQNSGLPANTCASAITIENQVDIDQTALCLHESDGIYPACPSTIKKGNAGGCYGENTYGLGKNHDSHLTLSHCDNMNSNSIGRKVCCTVYQADAPKVSPKPAAAPTTAAVPTPTAQQIRNPQLERARYAVAKLLKRTQAMQQAKLTAAQAPAVATNTTMAVLPPAPTINANHAQNFTQTPSTAPKALGYLDTMPLQTQQVSAPKWYSNVWTWTKNRASKFSHDTMGILSNIFTGTTQRVASDLPSTY